MKLIYALGSMENCSEIQTILKSVNASCRSYFILDQFLEEMRNQTCHLFVVAFENRFKTESAIQSIKREFSLKSVPILAFYPAQTPDAAARSRTLGANEFLLLPVNRHELLAKTGMLLSVDNRRNFKTLLTIEDDGGHSYIGTSEDFSTAGISFMSETRLSEKQQVSLQFFLPGQGQDRIRLLATIMRKTDLGNKSYFYGARFADPLNRFSDKIKNFIDRK
jgi:DNA-binding response OmpR family regulator